MSNLYLLDANVLISANNKHFPVKRIPQYWNWLLIKADAGVIKIPGEIYQEITPENSDFSDWIKTNKEKLILNEQFDRTMFNEVINRGYEIPRSGDEGRLEVSDIKNDAILIAYAMAHRKHRVVVTNQNKKPNQIPYVCETLDVKCINDLDFEEECDFRFP